MKFIITDFFEKCFNKVVKDMKIEELIDKINIESKNFINLKEPYVKIKIKSNSKTYRLLIAFDSGECIILCINIFDKKDKKYWENLSWQLHKWEIIKWRDRNTKDIIENKYYKIKRP